jgi:outer membrane protein OmpA-like peptidoglycan-associated protein
LRTNFALNIVSRAVKKLFSDSMTLIQIKMALFRTLFLVLALIPFLVQAQTSQRIKLANPSFEDIPAAGRQPMGWQDCGFPGETPPDTQYEGGTFFNVNKTPQNGKSYLGMVARDNDTWERVGQRLSKPIEGSKTYTFSIWLCRSDTYKSQSRMTHVESSYTNPVILRVWSGNGYCDRAELLGETAPVGNTGWMEYKFVFKPKKSGSYITFETYYKKGSALPYNGNLLLDNASDLVYEDKPTPPPPPTIADTKPKPKPADTKPKPKPGDKPVGVVPTPYVKPNEPAIMPDLLDRSTLSIGKKMRVNKLSFKADSATITPDSYAVLDEIATFLIKNKDIEIEIGGHTNGVPADAFCDKLSLARAKIVANYLISKGVAANRLTTKGYGKRQPLVSNATIEGRKTNQRVELKIMSMTMKTGK